MKITIENISDLNILNMLENLKFETAKKYITTISEELIKMLDVEQLANAHNARFKEEQGLLDVNSEELLDAMKKSENKLELMIQLTFLINKCAKEKFLLKSECLDSNNEKVFDDISVTITHLNSMIKSVNSKKKQINNLIKNRDKIISISQKNTGIIRKLEEVNQKIEEANKELEEMNKKIYELCGTNNTEDIEKRIKQIKTKITRIKDHKKKEIKKYCTLEQKIAIAEKKTFYYTHGKNSKRNRETSPISHWKRVKESNIDMMPFLEYCDFENREKSLYGMKHKLLSMILKELIENPDNYKEYMYGFVKDSNEQYVFVINIPGHLGSYQFHIEINHENDILYDVKCKKISHELGELAKASLPLGEMNFIKGFSKSELNEAGEGLDGIKNKLEYYMKAAKNFNSIDEESNEILRMIFLYSILLCENPKTNLLVANHNLADAFIHKTNCGLLSDYKGNGQTIRGNDEYNSIMSNLKNIHTIHITSPNTVDSKVVIEAIKRAYKEFFADEEDKEELSIHIINQGEAVGEEVKGLFINLNRNGNDFTDEDRIFINADEKLGEKSVCAVLDKIGGFEIPQDCIFYTGRGYKYAPVESNSAYRLCRANTMTGEKIFELCEELNKDGKHLIDAQLSEEQISRYGLNKARKDIGNRLRRIKSKKHFKIVNIENKKVAIYYDAIDGLADEYAYSQGCDICICMQEYNPKDLNKKKGIRFSISSQEVLPYELREWAYERRILDSEERQNWNWMLVQPTRIICNGKTDENVFALPDGKSIEDYKQEMIHFILNNIHQSELREVRKKYDNFLDCDLTQAELLLNAMLLDKGVGNETISL